MYVGSMYIYILLDSGCPPRDKQGFVIAALLLSVVGIDYDQ